MKHYAQRRKTFGAVQWMGDLTSEVRELVGSSNISVNGDLLTLGNGRVAAIGDWIYQVFLERDDSRVVIDLAVMTDAQFRALHEVDETGGSAPTNAAHDENFNDFVKDLDGLLVDGLRLSQEAQSSVFRARTRLLGRLRSLLDDERFLATRRERKRILDKLTAELT